MPFLVVAILIVFIPVLGYLFFAAFALALPIALIIFMVVIVKICRSKTAGISGVAEQSAEVFIKADQEINRKHLKENLNWLPPDKN